MKRALLCLTLLLLAVSVLGQTTTVPPLMNFQGQLSKPNGTPLPDGTYSVTFSFYDALMNGNLQWTESRNVTVHNGAFSILLGVLNVLNDSVFAGNRWLELKINTDLPLKPRQQIVSTAYAFKANIANTVPDGSVTDVKIAPGTITADKFATGVGAFALPYAATVNSASTLFSITNSGTGTGIAGFSNSAGAGIAGVVGTDTGSNGTGVIGQGSATGVFGGATLDYGAGVFGSDPAAFGTGVSGHGGANGVFGGNTNNTSALPSAGGSAGITGYGGGTGVEGYSTVSDGAGVIGEANGSAAVGVRGSSTGGTGVTGSGVTGVYGSSRNGNGVSGSSAGANGGSGVSGTSTLGKGVSGSSTNGTGVYGTGGSYAGYFSGLLYATNTGSGATALRVVPNLSVGVGVGVGDLAPYGQALLETNSFIGVTHAYFAENGIPVFYVAAGGATTVNNTLTVNGTTSTNVLEIRGGADLAERFDMDAVIQPGMVVEIDPEHEGRLRLAGEAYDTRVAGVVSGANSLAAGIVLTDPKGSRNAQPVAMSGRVWVYTDASDSAVSPGDFLTTSARAGYAMPVTDHARAEGAILGKAMSRLEKGRTGLVLVLVNLR